MIMVSQGVMEWFVYCWDINKHKLSSFNIFKHSGFKKDVSLFLKDCDTKCVFAEKVKRSLSYYFRAKSEYEVCMSAPFGRFDECIVDIYSQVVINWDNFIAYVWSFKEKD